MDLWEIKSQSGCKQSNLKRDGRPTTIIRRPVGLTRKIPGSSQNLSDIAKPVKNLPFPVLRLFLAGLERRVKSCDICKFTRAVANFRDCAPNRSIPPFVSDEGKERRSFTFFWREIRGVCIEKSGGSAFAQIHTHSHRLSQPFYSFNLISKSN